MSSHQNYSVYEGNIWGLGWGEFNFLNVIPVLSVCFSVLLIVFPRYVYPIVELNLHTKFHVP